MIFDIILETIDLLRYDAENENGRSTRGKQVKKNNPLIEELKEDGPTLADIRQKQLDEQKARNDAEFKDVDPVTRIQLQGYD